MLNEARESGADDVSTWSGLRSAPRAIGSDPFRESPVEATIGSGRFHHAPTHVQISVTALN